jgi:short-subunit dehydrogenase
MTKKAMVTGASTGIGSVFAKRLAEEGFQITAVARSQAKLELLMKELKGSHDFLVADLSTQEGQDAVVKRLEQEHFDLLVNNAGVGTVGAFTAVPIERQSAMISLNCSALIKLAHAFLVQSKSGDALINLSSCLAFVPSPGMAAYAATKAFVSSFSDALWFEQKSRGVYVMGLCPGITSTEFQVNAGGRFEDLPANLAQTPEVVVDFALASLKQREKPTVIPGFKNKMFAGMSRIMSRKRHVSFFGKQMKF